MGFSDLDARTVAIYLLVGVAFRYFYHFLTRLGIVGPEARARRRARWLAQSVKR